MKRLAIFLIGMILAFSLTGVSFAREKAKAPKKGVTQTGQPQAGGLVTALDAAGKNITIKQDKVKSERTLTLKISQQAANDLAGVKVGDEVNVWFTDHTLTALKRVF